MHFSSYSQVNLYPSHYGQLPIAKGLYNPSLQYTSGFFDLTSANQFYSTQFSQIRNLFLLGSVSLQRYDTLNIRQKVGIKFVSEVEGEYLSRTKFYISYLWSTRLSKGLRLNAASNLGRASYTYHATLITSSATSGNWDGDVGISLTGKTFALGFSVNQIFNSRIAPMNLQYIWKRFLSAYLEKQYIFSRHLKSDVFFHGAFLEGVPSRFDVGLQFIVSDKLVLGANYYIHNSITFNTGLEQLKWHNQFFSLRFSYTYPLSKQIKLNVQNYELGLHYFLKRKN